VLQFLTILINENVITIISFQRIVQCVMRFAASAFTTSANAGAKQYGSHTKTLTCRERFANNTTLTPACIDFSENFIGLRFFVKIKTISNVSSFRSAHHLS